MARRPVHNLPRFKENAPFPRPDRPSEWVRQQGSLKRLGQSLLVDEDPFADQDEPIRAIPDPWAQARTFAEAVIDEEHSMHRSFVSQWRGLLALIALRRLNKADYTLDSRPVDLDGPHLFNKVLKRLSPRIAIGDELGLWARPTIVYVTRGGRQTPIAMMNPACLISPGRLGSQIDVPNVPWAQQGVRDPLSLTGEDALPSAYLVVLRSYVENLRTKLSAVPASAAGDAIRQRLQQYLDEIDAVLGVTPLAARVGQGFNPDLHAIYQSVWSTVELEDVANPAATSQCRLALKSKTGHGALKGVILVDESLGKTGGRSARELLVWGTRTLTELLTSRPTFEEVKRQAAEHGYLVVTADDLFTPRAVRLRKNPKIPGHPVALKDLLIPVRPLALLLEGSLPTLVDADCDSARCSVMLRVKLDQESGTVSHTLTRHYRDEGADENARLVPDANWAFFNAAVWPNFRTSAWSSYFARLYYQIDSDQIRPRRALSRGIIEAALENAPDAQQAVSMLSRINSGQGPEPGPSWYRQSEMVSEVERDVIQMSDRGFEAIFYTDFDEERGEADAGCVWLDVKVQETTPVPTDVAVDFGTTNTVACFKDRKPIQFQQRLVNPISFDDTAAVQQQRELFRWQFADFMPPDKRDLPTPTVAIARKGTNREAEISVFRNVIYFSPAAAFGENGAKAELEKYRQFFSRAMFNLKWSDDPAHVLAASDFLEQMMMMIAAEAAAKGADPTKLIWRFSLPDSMHGRIRRTFSQHLTELVAKISPAGQLDGLYSEAMAAAKYMLAGNSGARVVPGTINAILDIGGGTTDVTLWAQDDPLWRGSFRMAGQAFFTHTIVQNPQILRAIGLGDWADLLDPPEASVHVANYEGISDEDIPHLAELLFSGPGLSRALDEHWALKLNLKAGETLRAAALVFLGGLAHYLGQVARQLVEEGIITSDQLADPTFALCGRGAGLFARIHGKLPPGGHSDVTSALKLFSHAAEAPTMPRPRLFLEPESKLEVVRGMVTEYTNIDARLDARREPRSSTLPAGIGLQFSSGPGLDATMTVGAPLESAKVSAVDVAQLEKMLQKLAEEAEIRVDLRKSDSEGAHGMICNEVRAQVDRSLDEDGQIVLYEPPYITALRALIGEIAKADTDPTRRITIEVVQ
ncbi:MAG TPA: hypothetical protein VEW25_14360 [Allosphingosinicella sp.]|nr:hypothetical protein [Allosphingosinicella sp.]